MGRLIVSEFVTLDGVMEDPGGSEGTPRGGWALQFERGPEGDKFKYDELMEAEALLLGRVTYEGFADAWPSRTGEFADRLNGIQKYVVSSTLRDPKWQNTKPIKGDVAGEVTKLKSGTTSNILVAGSRQLVDTLLQNGLVDEYRLMVFPVVLGEGKLLFKEGAPRAPLKLIGSKAIGRFRRPDPDLPSGREEITLEVLAWQR